MKRTGIVTLKADHCKGAYSPPGMSLNSWFTMSTAREVKYVDMYEPYFLALTGSFPDFDPRFRGWGGNKSIQEFQMAVDGYKFILLPNVFTFVPETPNEGKMHPPPSDPYLIDRAWQEIGSKRGCSSCTFWACIQNCPGLVNKNSMASSAASSSSSSMSLIMNSIQPQPIITKHTITESIKINMDNLSTEQIEGQKI